MRLVKVGILAFLVLLFCFGNVYSQLSVKNERPYSYSNTELMNNIPTYSTSGINEDSLKELENEEYDAGKTYRFASLIYTQLDMFSEGKWTQLENGDKLWQLQIYSPGARSLSFNFDDYQLPKGAKFFIYNPYDTLHLLGAFTEINNKENRKFTTGMINSEYVVLEYYEPSDAEFTGSISIHSIAHGYIAPVTSQKGFGDSEDCNNNINCPDWPDWQTVMKSVVMIVTDSGRSLCSGTLVNNENEDERNFILTTESALDGTEDSWIFYFRYEQPTCDSVYEGPNSHTVYGAEVKASGGFTGGNFALLETLDTIPHDFDIAYAGWNISTSASNYSHSIHHPIGDVKKISFDSSSVTSSNGYLWKTQYTPSLTGSGLLEGGSAGAPLFDTDLRIVAQFATGTVPTNICTDTTKTMSAYWGKFDVSYDDNTTDSTTYLKYWLDPDNTGTNTLDFLYPNELCCVSPIRGNVDKDPYNVVDVSDLLYLVDFVYYQGPVPPCEREGDVDASGEIDIGDIVYLVDYIFNNSTPPAACQ